jgi:hypothetical protein
MNALAEQFDSVHTDSDDEIAESKDLPNAPIVAPSYQPQVIKPLSGYESIMRRHAAACEAGR